MKINLIIFISEFNLGGAGNSLFKLCKNLPKNKFEITVICLNKCFYKSRLNKLNIRVYEVNSNKTILGMFQVRKIVKNLIKNDCKNIFLSNIHYTNILSVIFLKSLNTKLILVERTPHEELSIYYSPLDFFKKNILKLLIRLTFHKADKCISNSKYISSKYNKIYNLQFKTIHPPSFKEISKLKKKKNDKKNVSIGIVSRLSREKKIDKLINVLSEINEKISLKIIGDGPDKKKLIKLCKKLNMSKKIRFLGSRNPEKIKLLMNDFDYFINISDFEGFPNSVVEALSCKVPVIASQSFGGINDILKNNNYGFIFKNTNELKIALKNLVQNKLSFNFKKNILHKHLNNFSEKKNTENYLKIFEKI